MTKPKYTREEKTAFLKGTFPDYETLMSLRKGLIFSIERKGGVEEKEKLDEVILLSLGESAKRIFNEEGDISLQHIQEEHSGLDRAARNLLERKDRKSPWQQVCESAGLVYPCKKYKEWSLAKLLETIGVSNEDFSKIRHSARKFNGSNLYEVSKCHLGTFGKLAILSGIDYLKFPRVEKVKYQFRGEDFEKLIKDESPFYSQKVACIFNAFALQYYKQEAEGRMGRNQEEGLEGCLINRQTAFFNDPSITLSQAQKQEGMGGMGDSHFYVSMSLAGAPNKFYRQSFYFSAGKAIREADLAIDFFDYLATSMRVLDQKLQYGTRAQSK
ncbi:MAG TPA: hypothetical protein HA282_02955 [Nanoarchaeota archaeon]|nr:MAG: hypothetical protein QT01_C0008G0026 [archaeon GW2011_AR6]MBS3082995.1 hypothetical protein [Candidatus Pacearchaeota archaeon]HIH17390.1 hypothetical protein [Nanoarchaeota archaeon]HIH34716.1 hypothetical protein [Nanoarchaeota archaeon]HIH66152.1 hypothetical protein [Nanoarchaeota archaeon]